VDQPKKPLSAFFLYSAKRRPDLKVKNPDMKLGDVSPVPGHYTHTAYDSAWQAQVVGFCFFCDVLPSCSLYMWTAAAKFAPPLPICLHNCVPPVFLILLWC